MTPSTMFSTYGIVVEPQETTVYIPRIRKEYSRTDIDLLLHRDRIGEIMYVEFNEIAPNSVFAPSAKTIAEFNSAIVVFKFYSGNACEKAAAAKEGLTKDGFYNWYVKNNWFVNNSSRHSEECFEECLLLLPYKAMPYLLAKNYKSTPLNPLAKEFVPASNANATVKHEENDAFDNLYTRDEVLESFRLPLDEKGAINTTHDDVIDSEEEENDDFDNLFAQWVPETLRCDLDYKGAIILSNSSSTHNKVSAINTICHDVIVSEEEEEEHHKRSISRPTNEYYYNRAIDALNRRGIHDTKTLPW